MKAIQQTLLQTPENIIRAYFKDKDGNPLLLTSYQSDFVKAILSGKHTRIIFIAARQSGKSEAIACAIALCALFLPNERIVNISYTDDQARIIFERVKAHLVDNCKEIREFVDLDRSLGKSKEFSKRRMFMKNGTELRVLSTGTGETEKTGESILGFEATILVVDEAGSIPDQVFFTKIMPLICAKRTIGRQKLLILSGTPHIINHFESSWRDPNYKKFHVDWKTAVNAGRLNEKAIMEQRQKMTKSDFECWFEARFPSMTEDSVFDMEEIERNIITEDLCFRGIKILSVDVARFGGDFTVYTMLDFCDNTYRIVEILKDEKKDLMHTTGHILALNTEFHFDKIIVDESGLGGGVIDRLKEQSTPNVSGVVAGSKCSSEEIAKNCLNLKAELYMKAKKLFEENRLKIIARQELLHELRQMKKEYQSNGKLKIVDPDKSPDFVDSMVYGLYKPNTGAFIVLDMDKKDENQTGWH